MFPPMIERNVLRRDGGDDADEVKVKSGLELHEKGRSTVSQTSRRGTVEPDLNTAC